MSSAIIPSRNGREASIHSRYASAAREKEESLCCPARYSPQFLKVIPREILDRDYGCGDPTPYVRQGDTVLDLGSGGGKVCYILSQVVGSQGQVIGVDCNPDMLALARRCRELEAPLIHARLWCRLEADDRGTLRLQTPFQHYEDIRIGLAGRFQIDNARIAISALEHQLDALGLDDETTRLFLHDNAVKVFGL